MEWEKPDGNLRVRQRERNLQKLLQFTDVNKVEGLEAYFLNFL